MSSFSRGLFSLRRQCLAPRFFSAVPPPASRRFLTSSPILLAIKKLPKFDAKKTSISSIKAAGGKATPLPASYQSFASQLATKTSPTLIYQAPSHTLYMWCAYSSSLFCFSYAIYNYAVVGSKGPDVHPMWITVSFTVICVLMAAFGGWMVLAPARLIKTITAFPSKSINPGVAPVPRIQIELRKMFPFPFFPARVITTTPQELSLNSKLYIPRDTPQVMSADKKLLQEARLRQGPKLDRSKTILTLPFRQMSRGIHSLFSAVKRTWHREGFLKLRVGKQAYKLDVSGGWVLDEGRGLDKLVRHNPIA